MSRRYRRLDLGAVTAEGVGTQKVSEMSTEGTRRLRHTKLRQGRASEGPARQARVGEGWWRARTSVAVEVLMRKEQYAHVCLVTQRNPAHASKDLKRAQSIAHARHPLQKKRLSNRRAPRGSARSSLPWLEARVGVRPAAPMLAFLQVEFKRLCPPVFLSLPS